MNLKSLIESLLLVADKPVPIAQLERTLEAQRASIDEALGSLAADYQDRGLRLQRLGEEVQIVTAPEAAPCVERFLGLQAAAKLSPAALETLAIIAYRQPLPRSAIEALRGVNCERVLATLQARGLIDEVGRLEAAGRPILFGTTFEFLQYFGLSCLEELPPLEIPPDKQP